MSNANVEKSKSRIECRNVERKCRKVEMSNKNVEKSKCRTKMSKSRKVESNVEMSNHSKKIEHLTNMTIIGIFDENVC
jgi:hypothetical protein